jgi:hypothetical protein
MEINKISFKISKENERKNKNILQNEEILKKYFKIFKNFT